MRVLRMALVAVVVLAAWATLGLVSATGATPTGGIAGTVRDANTGQPIANITVVVTTTGAAGQSSVQTCSGADGSYLVSGLTTGSYAVTAGPGHCPAAPIDYHPASTTVSVTAPATTSGVDFALQPAGVITGTVTDQVSGLPLAGVQVDVTDATGGFLAQACTDPHGHYAVGGLDAGNYTVEFLGTVCPNMTNAFSAQYYPGTGTRAQASPVVVSDGTTAGGIDAALARDPTAPGTLITGTVIDRATGGPVADVQVSLTATNPSFGAIACTDSQGRYLIGGVASATDAVTFNPDTVPPACAGGANYFAQEYKDVDPTLSLGNPEFSTPGTTFTPAPGSVTSDVDGSLAPATTISGRVTDAVTGQGANKVLVVVYDAGGNMVSSACTGADGTYTTRMVPDGTYRVGFGTDPSDYVICLSTSNGYLAAYYRGATTLATATPITVSGTPVTGIDGAVTAGASISGTVTQPGAADVPGGVVEVFDSAGQRAGYSYVFNNGKGQDTYTIGALTPGRYTVKFSGGDDEDQYWKGTPVQSAATPVVLGEGQNVTNVNAVMVPTAQTGSLSGTVTDTTTQLPVGGVIVGVATPGGALQGTAVTAADGSYSISGVPAGSYDVAYLDPTKAHILQFSRDSATPAHATPVLISGGAKLTGVNAALVKPAAGVPAAVVSASTLTPSPAGVISVDLACPGRATCAGRLGLSALQSLRSAHRAAPQAAHTVAVKPFAVATGHVHPVRFTLSRPALRRLATSRRARVTLTLRVGRVTTHYTVTLKVRAKRR